MNVMNPTMLLWPGVDTKPLTLDQPPVRSQHLYDVLVSIDVSMHIMNMHMLLQYMHVLAIVEMAPAGSKFHIIIYYYITIIMHECLGKSSHPSIIEIKSNC